MPGKENEKVNIAALLDLVSERQTQQTDDIEFLKKADDNAVLEQKMKDAPHMKNVKIG